LKGMSRQERNMKLPPSLLDVMSRWERYVKLLPFPFGCHVKIGTSHEAIVFPVGLPLRCEHQRYQAYEFLLCMS